MGWRPFDNGSFYSYSGPNHDWANFSGPMTWACWARFHAGVTGGDEWIFGNSLYNFARQGGSNVVYSHVTNGSGAHSFRNGPAIGADPGNWYHLLGTLRQDGSNLHRLFVNGSGSSTGTTLTNPGGLNPILLSYDSHIEVAHGAVWSVSFSDAEVAAFWFRDPLLCRPDRLRAYWPLAGRRARQMGQYAPRFQSPSDGLPSSVSGTRAILMDDSGPPRSHGWHPLELVPQAPLGIPPTFVPYAVLV